jgi:hypothetical protein
MSAHGMHAAATRRQASRRPEADHEQDPQAAVEVQWQ